MADSYQAPNLASVLATLAAYTPPQPAPPLQTISLQESLQPAEEGEISEGEYDPSAFIPTTDAPTQPQSSRQPTPLPARAPPCAPQTPTPSVSVSAIISWSTALRHTTLLLSRNPTILPRIRHLIGTAHSHERQWFAGREALVQKISNRDAGRRKLDEALASVGGLVGGNAGAYAEAGLSVEEELGIYDRKVHRACREMVQATEGELARLGIPFFGVRTDLMGEAEGKISQGELRKLQKKMVGFLEEFCEE